MRYLLPILFSLALLVPSLAAAEGGAVRPPQPGDWCVMESYTEQADGERGVTRFDRSTLAGMKDHAWLVVEAREPNPGAGEGDDESAAIPPPGKVVYRVVDGRADVMATLEASEKGMKFQQTGATPERMETPTGVFACVKKTYAFTFSMMPEEEEDDCAITGEVAIWISDEVPFPGFVRMEFEAADMGEKEIVTLRERGHGPPPAPETLAMLEFEGESLEWE